MVSVFSLDMLTAIKILRLKNQSKHIVVDVKSFLVVTQMDKIHRDHTTDDFLKMKDTNVQHNGFYSAFQLHPGVLKE